MFLLRQAAETCDFYGICCNKSDGSTCRSRGVIELKFSRCWLSYWTQRRVWLFSECNQEGAAFRNLFFSVRRSTCFRRFFLPSLGAQNCTYSVRYWSDAVYAVLSSWWWKENPSETCRASYRNKEIVKRRILLVVLWEYISGAQT